MKPKQDTIVRAMPNVKIWKESSNAFAGKATREMESPAQVGSAILINLWLQLTFFKTWVEYHFIRNR